MGRPVHERDRESQRVKCHSNIMEVWSGRHGEVSRSVNKSPEEPVGNGSGMHAQASR